VGLPILSFEVRSSHNDHQGFQAARGRAGQDKKLVPYSARHAYGTYTMEKSGNAFAVSKSIGNADLKSRGAVSAPETGTIADCDQPTQPAKKLVRFGKRILRANVPVTVSA
jgi:hypothetical protein